MRRDMDLIRDLLLELEASEDFQCWKTGSPSGYSPAQIAYHTILIHEAGLAEVWVSDETGVDIPETKLIRLTWEGHNFLDASRDSTRWIRAKEIFAKIGGASFDVAMRTLTELATRQALSQIGVPLP